MSTEGCDFVQYSYHKTAHYTTQYGAVHYTCGNTMQLLNFASNFIWFKCGHAV